MRLAALQALLCLVAMDAAAQEGQEPLARALAGLGAAEAGTRREAEAWLLDHLQPIQVRPFLLFLGQRQDEARWRGLAILAARPDLFGEVAGAILRTEPGLDPRLVEQAVQAMAASPQVPRPDRAQHFLPVPAVRVRLAPRRWAPLELASLWGRNLEMPLPLILWPHPAWEGWSWEPSRTWGGDLRSLLDPAAPTWLAGGRVEIRNEMVLILPPGEEAPRELSSLLGRLLSLLAHSSGRRREEAALALGLLPFPPLDRFLAGAAEGPPRELALALAVRAVRTGLAEQDRDRAGVSLRRQLGAAPDGGELLAWTAAALGVLGPGADGKRGELLAQALREAPLAGRWRYLLPALRTPFPALGPVLEELLGREDLGAREAALAVRALGILGRPVPGALLRRACALAGPGPGLWGGRLGSPLAEAGRAEARRDLASGNPGLEELAACGLALSGGAGQEELLSALGSAPGPRLLGRAAQALRLAADQGDLGPARLLWDRWREAPPRDRLGSGILLALLLDEGRFLDDEERPPGAPPAPSDRLLVRLALELKGAAGTPLNPLGPLAAQAMGRLLGLQGSGQVGEYLEWVQRPDLRERTWSLLEEWSGRVPLVALHLGSLGRRDGDGLGPELRARLAAIGEGRHPPPGSGTDLGVVDPLAWAMIFPAP